MRKRSKYKPRAVHLDTMAWVMGGFKKLTDLTDQNFVVRSKNHAAMKSMADGTGCRDDIEILIGALNMTEALAINDIGSDWKAEILAGHDALLMMARRGYNSGRFLFTGPELTAVNLAMEVHDAQLDAATVVQLEKAMGIVNRIVPKQARAVAV